VIGCIWLHLEVATVGDSNTSESDTRHRAAELQDEVVGVGGFDEVGAVLVDDLLERMALGSS
jgi:hypothetical protein